MFSRYIMYIRDNGLSFKRLESCEQGERARQGRQTRTTAHCTTGRHQNRPTTLHTVHWRFCRELEQYSLPRATAPSLLSMSLTIETRSPTSVGPATTVSKASTTGKPMSVLTPVQARREFFEKAFQNQDQHHGAEPNIQHGLVHDRLQWIADEKRKSLNQTSPDNKDASENIPPHLVAGRKKWLADQMANMTVHQQQAFIARLSKTYNVQSMKELEESNVLVEVDDYDTHAEAILPVVEALDEHDLMVDTLTEDDSNQGIFEDLSEIQSRPHLREVSIRRSFSLEEHPEEPPRIGTPRVETLSVMTRNSSSVSSSSTLSARQRQHRIASASPHGNSSQYVSMPSIGHSGSVTSAHSSITSLADYARQSAQTMARARLPVSPFPDEELIIDTTLTSPRSRMLSPMSMTSPRYGSPTILVDSSGQGDSSKRAAEPHHESTESTLDTAISSSGPPRATSGKLSALKGTAPTTEPVAVKCEACIIL